eukprot:gene6334-8721_t
MASFFKAGISFVQQNVINNISNIAPVRIDHSDSSDDEDSSTSLRTYPSENISAPSSSENFQELEKSSMELSPQKSSFPSSETKAIATSKGLIYLDAVKNNKKGTPKSLCVHLYKGIVFSVLDRGNIKKKQLSVADIQTITRTNENTVTLELKAPSDMQVTLKTIRFCDEENATKFQKYVEVLCEFGTQIRLAYDQINQRKEQSITALDIKIALNRVDLKVSDEELVKMLYFNKPDGNGLEYGDFFNIFLDSPVYSLRDCLEEWLIQATNNPSDSHLQDTNLDIPQIPLLPGEIITLTYDEKFYYKVNCGLKPLQNIYQLPGIMYVTNYRIVIKSLRKLAVNQSKHSKYDAPAFFSLITIPLATVSRIISINKNVYIMSKDYRNISISIGGIENLKVKAENLSIYLIDLVFNHEKLFAFKFDGMLATDADGWNLCDISKEYERQGLLTSSEWQIYDNSNYDLCESYPKFIALPKQLHSSDIIAAASFRSKNRIPAITYLHKKTGAVMTRSSQPMVGLTQKNSAEDAMLLNQFRTKGHQNPYDYM